MRKAFQNKAFQNKAFRRTAFQEKAFQTEAFQGKGCKVDPVLPDSSKERTGENIKGVLKAFFKMFYNASF